MKRFFLIALILMVAVFWAGAQAKATVVFYTPNWGDATIKAIVAKYAPDHPNVDIQLFPVPPSGRTTWQRHSCG